MDTFREFAVHLKHGESNSGWQFCENEHANGTISQENV